MRNDFIQHFLFSSRVEYINLIDNPFEMAWCIGDGCKIAIAKQKSITPITATILTNPILLLDEFFSPSHISSFR